MLRQYAFILGAFVLGMAIFSASGCRNNQMVVDPFGATRIPPPATSVGGASAPAAPYYNQPQPAQPQFSQPPTYPQPANTTPGGLVPVPQNTQPPIYPGGPTGPTYQPGSNYSPPGTSGRYSPSRAVPLARSSRSRVQPVSHEPRLRPVPTIGDSGVGDSLTEATSEASKFARDVDDQGSESAFKSVVTIGEDGNSEPVIQIEEPPATARGDNRQTRSPSAFSAAPASATVAASSSPRSRHSSVLKNSNSTINSAENPPKSIRVVADRSEERIDIADLPGHVAEAKSQPKFRAMATTPAARYGHADDYSWLKGKLEYSAARKEWKLRYIPLDGTTDEYGGSVILDHVNVSDYSAGDFVAVRGKLAGRDAEARDFSTSYQVQQMKSM